MSCLALRTEHVVCGINRLQDLPEMLSPIGRVSNREGHLISWEAGDACEGGVSRRENSALLGTGKSLRQRKPPLLCGLFPQSVLKMWPEAW